MRKQKLSKISGWGNYPVVNTKLKNANFDVDIKKLVQKDVISRGLGRSYGDQAVNEGFTTIDCSGLNKILSFDEESGTLECESGTSLEQIIKIVAPKGWFPMICPGTKFITIGGAIANDVHGKAHHIDGTFVNCVESFSILMADERILQVSRQQNSDLFWANFGGLGLLGIILTVRLKLRKIETTYFSQKAIKTQNLDELLEALKKYDETCNYSVAWIDPFAKGKHIGRGVLTVGNMINLKKLPEKIKRDPLKLHKRTRLNLPFFLPNFALNGTTSRVLNLMLARIQNSPKEVVHYEKFFFPLDMVNNWNRGYGSRGFIQYQFVIPKDKGNLRKILIAISQSGCTPFLNVFKVLGKEQGMLSFPFEGYTLAIDFPMSRKLLDFAKILDKMVLEAGGRLYLGKDALLDRNTFENMYPQIDDWKKIKKKYDPGNFFTSNISRRLGLSEPF